MKAFRWTIWAGALAAMLLGGVATAQDNAYLTPSKAKELRQKEEQARNQRIAQRKAQREQQKAEYERLQTEQEQVSDWYNRRDMKVTIEQMEDNLDQLDGTVDRRPRGGKYSQRMRRFGDNSNTIVLNNVDRVYILDDMDYDPWTNSYYGRDWRSGVNIHINTYPYYGSSWRYGRWYDPWSYGRWYDPWYYYGGWYDPWYYGGVYDPWYRSRWRDPWYYGGGWGYTYGWGAPSYSHGYWHGYYDGSHYGSGYTRTRTYNPYGRTSGRYVQRNHSTYGSDLGRTDRAVRTRATTGTQVYNRNTNGGRYNNSGTQTNSGTRTNSRWNQGSTPTRTYTPTRSTNGGGSYTPSTPSTPTRSSNPGNTGTYGSGGRRR